ncbi:uncharacterized protein LOC108833053 isoform X1 [Raphanus sativus]|uniref:Uncharacterized protein LOC108833053 isoform X1 n=1 Tax=Raphanus sativus TaxID=3726 RepID=A0A6J0LNZ8_RAPSA|nr:uncharacterized protein LOC108833053 isoform X1 [Raphanus sativus]
MLSQFIFTPKARILFRKCFFVNMDVAAVETDRLRLSPSFFRRWRSERGEKDTDSREEGELGYWEHKLLTELLEQIQASQHRRNPPSSWKASGFEIYDRGSISSQDPSRPKLLIHPIASRKGKLYLNSKPVITFYFAIKEFISSLGGAAAEVFPCIDTREGIKKELVPTRDLNTYISNSNKQTQVCVSPGITGVISVTFVILNRELIKLIKQDAATLALEEMSGGGGQDLPRCLEDLAGEDYIFPDCHSIQVHFKPPLYLQSLCNQ